MTQNVIETSRKTLRFTAGVLFAVLFITCTTTNVNAGRHYTHTPVYSDGRSEAAFFADPEAAPSGNFCRCRPAPDGGVSPAVASGRNDAPAKNTSGYFAAAVPGGDLPEETPYRPGKEPAVSSRGVPSEGDPEGFFSEPPRRASAGMQPSQGNVPDRTQPSAGLPDQTAASVPDNSGRTPLSVPSAAGGTSGTVPASVSGNPPVSAAGASAGSPDVPWTDTPAPGEFNETGLASWYGRDFDGKTTASGQIFDSRRPTAAHKTIPLGSIIAVKNLDNNKEVMVVVNDRGPYVSGRILDVSEYSAELLDFKSKGLARVGIRLVKKGDGKPVSKEGVTASYFGTDGKIADPVPYKPVEAEPVPAVSGGTPLNINTPAVDPKKSRLPENAAASSEVLPVKIERESALKGYAVQVGIFEDMDNAVQLKRYLSSYGVPVGVYRRESKFVVKVGDYGTRFAAEQMKYRLAADGYSGFVSEPD